MINPLFGRARRDNELYRGQWMRIAVVVATRMYNALKHLRARLVPPTEPIIKNASVFADADCEWAWIQHHS